MPIVYSCTKIAFPCYTDTQRNGGKDLCTVKISIWYPQKHWISSTSCYDMTTMNDSQLEKPWNILTSVSSSLYWSTLYYIHICFQQISPVTFLTIVLGFDKTCKYNIGQMKSNKTTTCKIVCVSDNRHKLAGCKMGWSARPVDIIC
jgi:hypothetical protein